VKGKRVLITGEHGNLGGLLTKACRKLGAKVVNDNYSKLARHNKKNIPTVFPANYKNEINISDYTLIDEIIKNSKPEVIIHTAAFVGTDKCDKDRKAAYQVNVEAIESMIDSVNKNSPTCLFVNFSTTATMDPMSYSFSNPINESTKRGPQTWYGETKLMGENAVKKYSKKWINFLPVFLFNEYPTDNSSIWPKLFRSTLSNKTFEILMDPKNYKQYEHSSNVIKPIMKIIQNPESINKDIVVTGTEIKKFSDFLKEASDEFEDMFGKKLKYKVVPDADYLKSHVADNSLMFKLSGISVDKYNKKRISFSKAIKGVIRSCR
jgi:nucleoside-diphosphate-sugar epimerase